MTVDEIMNYVLTSPNNTNPNILRPVLEDLAKPEVPQINVNFDVTTLMTTVVTALVTSQLDNIIVPIDTTADNSLHTALVQCHQQYDNVLTDVKIGETNRHMIFHMDNNELFSSDGFYIDEENQIYATFKLVVQWNRIGVFATKSTMISTQG